MANHRHSANVLLFSDTTDYEPSDLVLYKPELKEDGSLGAKIVENTRFYKNDVSIICEFDPCKIDYSDMILTANMYLPWYICTRDGEYLCNMNMYTIACDPNQYYTTDGRASLNEICNSKGAQSFEIKDLSGCYVITLNTPLYEGITGWKVKSKIDGMLYDIPNSPYGGHNRTQDFSMPFELILPDKEPVTYEIGLNFASFTIRPQDDSSHEPTIVDYEFYLTINNEDVKMYEYSVTYNFIDQGVV